MEKKITAIVQARMNSGRLSQKSLADVEGKPMLQRVIERVLLVKEVSRLIVATSIHGLDDPLAAWCEKTGILCHRGSENDVLDRFYQAGKRFGAEAILRVTADDPLKDPEVFSEMIRIFRESGADYASNTLQPTYPEGLDGEIFSFAALEKALNQAAKPSEREHVTPYIWGHPEIFNLKSMTQDRDLSRLRWTVDYPEDLEFVRTIYRKFAPRVDFSMNEILALLEKEPHLQRTDRDVPRNEGYLKSLKQEYQKP